MASCELASLARRRRRWARAVARRCPATGVALALLASAAAARAGERLAVEAFLGTAASLPMGLHLRQRGEPDIEHDARYATRPLDGAPYYAVRIRFGGGPSGWELQLLHHKVHLTNPPPEVDAFQITHGLNLLTVNRAAARGRLVVRLGAGLVLAHPESVVRGRSAARYALTGPAFLAGIGGPLAVSSRLRLLFEGQVSIARVRAPIAGGDASAPNVALHALVGVGWGL